MKRTPPSTATFLLLALAFVFFGSRHMSQERALRFKVKLDEVQRI